MSKNTHRWRIGAGILLTLLVYAQGAFAQPDREEMMRRMERFRRSRGGEPSSTPEPQQKPAEEKKEEQKKEEKPAEAPKDAGPKPVTRPNSPSTTPKLDEQKLAVDEKQMVTFNFEGAPWSFVLDELARVSHMNLDWQELPGDFLNLRNPRAYSLDEARDAINQHLLARGYTILSNGVTLSVVNLEKLNPSAVPRISPDELDQRSPHEFVKVSFPLEWMLAETAVEEFKPMMSPKGKLTALKSTNRLEAIDAVINLREVRTLLAEEEGPGGRKLVEEIALMHTRAKDIQEQLEVFLGIKKEAPMAMPKNSQEQQMAMQMMQQMQQMRQQQQQQQQQQAGKTDNGKPKGEVHFSVNPRRNSILVQAPPDQMVIIRQTIKYLDVPSERPSLLSNSNLMQSYRLATVDPAILISTLESVGDLSPDTRLELDKTNRAIIAYASPVDQYKIRAVVERLDGTDRSLHVVKLRRLEADQVAGTIQKLLVGEQENSSQSRRRSYGYWGDYGRSSDSEEKKTGEFRVDADLNANRLLLWANDVEYQEVMKFLAELGEIPPQGGNSETLRVLDVESEDELLEQIRRAWPSLGPNQLIIEPSKKKPADNSKEAPKKDQLEDKSREPLLPSRGTTTAVDRQRLQFASFLQEGSADEPSAGETPAKSDEKPAAVESNEPPRKNAASDDADEAPPARRRPDEPQAEPAATPPPISITRGADGRLIISSQDTRALDRLEELVARMAPPRKDYEVFRLTYASAYWVRLNLEDFFKEEDKDNKNSRRGYFFWDYYGDQGSSNDTSLRLSKRRPLKFIDDVDSNTILVQGADTNQLKTIGELIHLYDQPEPSNSKMVRKTQIFQIRHSKAKVIADAVKDVFRDLLSANDKALEKQNDGKGARAERAYIYDFGDDGSKDINQGRFKGLLSIGIDEVSNILVVSAPENLMENVTFIIDELDRAAEPQAATFQVLKIDRNSNADEIQKKLAEILGRGVRNAQPQQPQQPQPPNGPPQNNRQFNGRGRNRDSSNDN